MYKEQEIIDWADDRGIIAANDKLTQGLKTLSEIAELSDNLLEHKDVSDDLGDIYVTIVVQAKLNNIALADCLEISVPERDTRKEQVADMIYDCGMMLQSIMDKDDFVSTYIGNIYLGLLIIANNSDLSLSECIDYAYNEIIGRQGQMVDGVFVKDG